MDNNGASCCRLGVAISVLALGVAVTSYFCPRKDKAEHAANDSALDDRIKAAVIDVIKHNPRLLMDAMGEGIAQQKEEATKHLANGVLEHKAELVKQGIRLGKIGSKNMVICFFDPLCKHCIDFQKSALQMAEAGKDIEFVLLPVVVLSEDSRTVGKVYYAVCGDDQEKNKKFIKAIVESKEVDKDALEGAAKKAGVSQSEMEAGLDSANRKLDENWAVAEKIKVPVVPGIFAIKGSDVQMLQATGVEQIQQAFDDGPTASEGPQSEDSAKDSGS
jgi:protein-disulfide isomerase